MVTLGLYSLTIGFFAVDPTSWVTSAGYIAKAPVIRPL
jgi:hypothetical protein